MCCHRGSSVTSLFPDVVLSANKELLHIPQTLLQHWQMVEPIWEATLQLIYSMSPVEKRTTVATKQPVAVFFVVEGTTLSSQGMLYVHGTAPGRDAIWGLRVATTWAIETSSQMDIVLQHYGCFFPGDSSHQQPHCPQMKTRCYLRSYVNLENPMNSWRTGLAKGISMTPLKPHQGF